MLASAASVVWHYAPDFTLYDVMETLYDSGSVLSNTADFCLGAACGDTKRVTVCEAVQKACDIGGANCPGPNQLPQCELWDMDPVDVSLFNFNDFDATSTGTLMEYQEHVNSSGDVVIQPMVNASCSERSSRLDEQDGVALSVLAECPDSQSYGVGAKPWTAPQPFGGPCTDCSMSLGSSMIRLTGTSNFSNFTMPTLSIKNTSGVTTNYSLGSLSGMNIAISFSNLNFGSISSATFSGFGSTGTSVSNSLYVND